MVVSELEVEPFEREFVSLFALTRQQGRHFMAVMKDFRTPASSRCSIPRLERRSTGGPISGGKRFDRKDVQSFFQGTLKKYRKCGCYVIGGFYECIRRSF